MTTTPNKDRLIEYINARLAMMTEKQLRLVLGFIKGFNYER